MSDRPSGSRRFGWGNLLFFALCGLVIAYGANRWFSHHGASNAAAVAVVLPASLSPDAQAGEQLFHQVCAACHGKNAAGGTDAGPPLIHKYYEPSHHGDGAFYNAVFNGVVAHHWNFGNMPPQDLLPGQVAKIVAYVREVQRANGID